MREEYIQQCDFSQHQLRSLLSTIWLLVEYLHIQNDEGQETEKLQMIEQIRQIGSTAYFFGGCDALRFLITGMEEAFLLNDALVTNHLALRHEINPCLNRLWHGIGEWQS